MIKPFQILFFGLLFLNVDFVMSQDIDSSYIGIYAIVLNYQEHDTIGSITLTSNTYTYSSRHHSQFESNRTFMNNTTGEYSIEDYSGKNETDTLNHYIIDFDPKNTDRNWTEMLQSTLGLNGDKGIWYLKDNTSRSFPQYQFYKLE